MTEFIFKALPLVSLSVFFSLVVQHRVNIRKNLNGLIGIAAITLYSFLLHSGYVDTALCVSLIAVVVIAVNIIMED